MRTGTDRSGLRYGVKRAGHAVAYCALHVRCGTRDEVNFHGGIAHFTEHTLFKGTRRRSASSISSRLDRLGGDLNAYTTKEEIVLHATVLKEDLGKALDLLLELATEATFPETEIETERGVIIDEIISYQDNPSEDIYDSFDEKLFAGHALGGRILGTVGSVKKITAEELRRFYATFFTPDRIALTVVADIDEKVLERRIRRKAEGRFPVLGRPAHQPTGMTANGPDSSSPVPTKVFSETVNKRNHEVNVIIGGAAPSLYGGHDRITTVLLMNLLGGPASNSILGSILREKNGWVYSVECSYTQYADTGLFTIAFGCDKPNLERCIACIEREMDRLMEKPLPPSRLKAARKQLLGQLAIASDNGEAQCLSMGKSLLSYGRVATPEENKASIEAVTAEDLMQLARRLFEKSRLATLIFI